MYHIHFNRWKPAEKLTALLAVLLASLTILLRTVPGVSFSANLCFLGVLACLVLLTLSRWGSRRRGWKILLRAAQAGLAVLFFWTLWRHGRAARSAAVEGSELSRAFTRRMLGTLAFCVAFFVIIPVLIYYFSYYWHLQSYGVQSLKDMFSKTMVDNVIQLQSRIFNYHSGLSGDTHYFRSPWYQWPIIWWPMWYYNGTPYMPDGVISSISCMGNPAVWWFGLAALLFVLIAAAWRRRAPRAFILVLIGFASQFLPWVLVPRSTFIYHYFASVPFIILASVLLLKEVRRRSEDGFRAASIALCTAALVLFIAFYPLESGAPAARSYAMLLRWFKWYNF